MCPHVELTPEASRKQSPDHGLLRGQEENAGLRNATRDSRVCYNQRHRTRSLRQIRLADAENRRMAAAGEGFGAVKTTVALKCASRKLRRSRGAVKGGPGRAAHHAVGAAGGAGQAGDRPGGRFVNHANV